MATDRKSTLGIEGFDPVAYFVNGQPRLGKIEFKHQFKGLTYCFSTKENMDKFVKKPDDYLPQFGGVCAFGYPLGSRTPGSPKNWKIVDGKLYFIANHMVRVIWGWFPFLIGRGQAKYRAAQR